MHGRNRGSARLCSFGPHGFATQGETRPLVDRITDAKLAQGHSNATVNRI
jgi:hypothetical protein